MDAIKQQQRKETENRKNGETKYGSHEKGLLTIKLKLDNPTLLQPLENYADKVNAIRNETQTKSTTDIRRRTRQSRDPRNILLIKKNQKFRDSIEIKKRLLPFIQTKGYCTPLLQRVAVNILSLQHQRRLTVFCRDGGLKFLERLVSWES